MADDEGAIHSDLWNGYFRRRRYWFLASVPALGLLLLMNVLRATPAGLIVVAAVTAAVLAIAVLVTRRRLRRRAEHVGAGDADFRSEGIALADGVAGLEEPWATLREAAKGRDLGVAGLLWLDADGVHWTTLASRPTLRIDLSNATIERCELANLGIWASGLGIWTTTGERLGLVLPKIDRMAVLRSLEQLGLVTTTTTSRRP